MSFDKFTPNRNAIATAFVAALVLCSQALSQQRNAKAVVQDFEILDSDRPLNDAFSNLENALRTPINFEEIPEPLSTTEPLPILTVHFVNGEDNAFSAAQTILAAYKRHGLPGNYLVTQDPGSVTIEPTAIFQSKNGEETSRPSLSSTLISLAEADRTIASTLDLIADALSRASGAKVLVLNQPYLLGERLQFGARDEPAMHVLERLSQAMSPLSIRFIYDRRQKIYYLNLKPVSSFRPEENVEQPISRKNEQRPTSSPFFIKTN